MPPLKQNLSFCRAFKGCFLVIIKSSLKNVRKNYEYLRDSLGLFTIVGQQESQGVCPCCYCFRDVSLTSKCKD